VGFRRFPVEQPRDSQSFTSWFSPLAPEALPRPPSLMERLDEATRPVGAPALFDTCRQPAEIMKRFLFLQPIFLLHQLFRSALVADAAVLCRRFTTKMAKSISRCADRGLPSRGPLSSTPFEEKTLPKQRLPHAAHSTVRCREFP